MRWFTPYTLLLLCSATPAWAAAPSAPVPMRPAVMAPVLLPRGAPLTPTPLAPASLPLDDPGMQCRRAIRAAEHAAGIPSQLMAAIGRIESGRADAQGIVHPWPWTINAEGEGHYFATKAEAIAAVQALQARGVRSVDVGCMQVNLMHHPEAFASLDQAFDPAANAAYAAHFLTQLFAQSSNWERATADYHSATPGLGEDYQHKVAAVLPEEQRRLGLTPALGGGNVWSTNVWSANVWNARGPAWPAPAPIARPAPVTAAAASAVAPAAAGGGNMLSNHADRARMIAAPAGTVGRSLQAYRATPIPIAARPVAANPPPHVPM